MKLREIVKEYDAVKFTGDNVDEVGKFIGRHGAQITWQTNEETGLTSGLIQTAEGTERIGRGAYVLANAQDQLSRAHRDEIESAQFKRFEIVDEEQATPDPVEDKPPAPTVMMLCESCMQDKPQNQIRHVLNFDVCQDCRDAANIA